jgi:uncharacterized protein (DUF2267 family)
LEAEAVSFWSGRASRSADTWDRLVQGCAEVVDHADRRQVNLGFEPEPGMVVDTLAQWRRLRDDLGAHRRFGLTLDIGHCRAVEPLDAAACVESAGAHLVNVQIDDMRRGVHEHLEFGEGEIDFPPVLNALRAVGYTGLVAVELPRHSHAAPDVAARSLERLRAAEWLGRAVEAVAADPERLATILPTVRRGVGREAAHRARVRLLCSTPRTMVPDLYRHGDNDEKRAVLSALHHLDDTGAHLDLLHDALRSNDPRLVAAALGPYSRHLDAPEWRQAVLKGVFMDLPPTLMDGIEERADAELLRMLESLRRERDAAGRRLSDDVTDLLERLSRCASSTPTST